MLEVGSGDGRSFEHYPPEVSALLAVEPDPTARESAAERARSAAVPIEIVDGVAERLPAEDGSMDAVVVMGVLCSVGDPARRPPGAPARPTAWRRAPLLGARPIEACALPGVSARRRPALLDEGTGRLRDDAGHRVGDPGRRVRLRAPRARLSLLVGLRDHHSAVHPRRRQALLVLFGGVRLGLRPVDGAVRMLGRRVRRQQA